MTTKISVDDSAAEYWKSYFDQHGGSDYGEALTSDVPRKIKKTLDKDGQLIPFGLAKLADGRFTVEAILHSDPDVIMVAATFRRDGKLLALHKQYL